MSSICEYDNLHPSCRPIRIIKNQDTHIVKQPLHQHTPAIHKYHHAEAESITPLYYFVALSCFTIITVSLALFVVWWKHTKKIKPPSSVKQGDVCDSEHPTSEIISPMPIEVKREPTSELIIPTGSSKHQKILISSPPLSPNEHISKNIVNPVLGVLHAQERQLKQTNRQHQLIYINEQREKMWAISLDYINWKCKYHIIAILLMFLIILPACHIAHQNIDSIMENSDVSKWNLLNVPSSVLEKQCDRNALNDDTMNVRGFWSGDNAPPYKNTMDYWLSNMICILKPIYRQRLSFYYDKWNNLLNGLSLLSSIADSLHTTSGWIGIGALQSLMSQAVMISSIFLFLFFMDIGRLANIFKSLLIFILIIDPIIFILLDYTRIDVKVINGESVSHTPILYRVAWIQRNSWHIQTFVKNTDWDTSHCVERHTNLSGGLIRGPWMLAYIHEWVLRWIIWLGYWRIGWILHQMVYMIIPMLIWCLVEYVHYWKWLVFRYTFIHEVNYDGHHHLEKDNVELYVDDWCVNNTLDINRNVLFNNSNGVYDERELFTFRRRVSNDNDVWNKGKKSIWNWRFYFISFVHVIVWLIIPWTCHYILMDACFPTECQLPTMSRSILQLLYLGLNYIIVPLYLLVTIIHASYQWSIYDPL